MLELNNISYTLERESRAKILDSISLKFKEGSFTVITGHNGSGKSTLAQIIMGIKQPTSGQILLDGQDITKHTITERAKLGLSYSFQQPVKFKGLTCYELLSIAYGELLPPELAAKTLLQVGLEPGAYLTRDINDKLSGGELKRIEIATLLLRDTKVMIFDEPEAGIDLWSFANLTKIFKKLKAKHRTIIIISHQERILKLADEVIILEHGKIKTKGAPGKILPLITGVQP